MAIVRPNAPALTEKPDAAAAAAAVAAQLVDESEAADLSEAQDEVSAAEPVSQLPATTRGGQLSVPSGNEDGFGSLDDAVGFGAFPIMKLEKSDFEFKGKQSKTVDVQMHGSRKKWIYKVKGSQDKSQMFYTYDNVYDLQGAKVGDRLSEWKRAGFGPDKVEHKEYAEVLAQIVDAPGFTDEVGEFCYLSIPPASLTRLGGYRMKLKFTGKAQMGKVITRLFAEAKVGTGSTAFHPWGFKYVSAVQDAAE